MEKGSYKVLKKISASFELFTLFIAIFSFAFILGGTEVVLGNDDLVAGEEAIRTQLLGGSEGVAAAAKESTSITPFTGWEEENLKALEQFFGVVPKDPGTTASHWGSEKGFFDLLPKGHIGNALLEGLSWGFVAYGIGTLVGSLIGLDSNNVQALSTSLAAGALVGRGFFLADISPLVGSGFASFGVGFGVAALVFVVMYKDTRVETVSYSCLPWQAPSGGDRCEDCNSEDFPCSQYRCKSLGQSCELLNAGTAEERCASVNPNDVNPPVITPSNDRLTSGHDYTNIRSSPPSPGFEIINLEAGDGCLKAFTPLTFGIDTDEPSQCKIDFTHTIEFDEMVSYVGGSNLYAYEHTEVLVLPNAKDIENSSGIELVNGQDLTFFIRCQDKNGNTNDAEYAVEFCVDPSPDTTPPKIEATSIINGGCIAEDQTSANVEFYTNEPSQCKWDSVDKDFDLMNNEMECDSELYQMNALQLFTCRANLEGIARDGTDFYVRCKDQPREEENNRNEMVESFVFNLRGSQGLEIEELKPEGVIFGSVSPAQVELYVETSYGCNSGQSYCFFSETGVEGDFISFFDTNNEDGISTQPLSLLEREHDFFIQCVDEGGNLAEEVVSFTLEIDEEAPVIARVYEEQELLKVVTIRNSECSYTLNSCDFTFEEGTSMPYANTTVHVAEWNNENTYYIKCRDEFRNEDADCSIIVSPTSNFL